MRYQAKRQRVRIGVLLASFALFPVTIFYFSPYLIAWARSRASWPAAPSRSGCS